MTNDELINLQHFKIRSWYLAQNNKYKVELPRDLYLLTKASLDKILDTANKYHMERDTRISRCVLEMNMFILPWPVLLWQSQQPKR